LFEKFKGSGKAIAEAIARLLVTTGVSPTQLTFVGFALSLGVAGVLGAGFLRVGGALLIVVGAFDTLDGALARVAGRATTFGAFLDSTLDRYSEGAMYIGLVAYFVGAGGPLERWLVLATVTALAGSFLVSYVRARAQSLGFTCETGLFARPERVVMTVIGLIFGGVVLAAVVFLLAILTNLTALQRIREVWLQGRAQRLEREREAAKALRSGQPVKP